MVAAWPGTSLGRGIMSLALILISLPGLVGGNKLGAPSTLSLTRKHHRLQHLSTTPNDVDYMMKIRGGLGPVKVGKKNLPKRESILKKTKNAYNKILPVSRGYFSLVLLLTLVATVQLIDPRWLVLDTYRTIRKFEFWRPFTAAAFLGPPSMSWLSNVYFLLNYGQSLEGMEGSAQQVMFLLSQIFTLALLGGFVGLPVTSIALMASSLHCCTRLDPKRDVNWMFGIKVKFWTLPFCMAAVDVIQAQSPFAALPHIVGILSGHLYHFVTKIWPRMGGREYLVAPAFIHKRFSKWDDDPIFRKPGANPIPNKEGDKKKSSVLSSLNKKKRKVYKQS